jgi:hypothetical protein
LCSAKIVEEQLELSYTSAKILADYFHDPACGLTYFIAFLSQNISRDQRDPAPLQSWDGFLTPHSKTHPALQAGTNNTDQINAKYPA